MSLSSKLFIKKIDTSLIGPNASDENVTKFIEKCKEYSNYLSAIAFNLHHVPLAVKLLKNIDIDVCAPVAYPLGSLPTKSKVAQAKYAVRCGAQQIDMCMEVGAFRSGKYELVEDDISAVVSAVKGKMKNIAVIANTAYLTNEEKIIASEIIRDAGATFVKTNTGFGLVTTAEDVKLIKKELGDTIKIMVSGGVRTLEQALAMFEAGAEKIATSRALQIFEVNRALGLLE